MRANVGRYAIVTRCLYVVARESGVTLGMCMVQGSQCAGIRKRGNCNVNAVCLALHLWRAVDVRLSTEIHGAPCLMLSCERFRVSRGARYRVRQRAAGS